MGKRAKSGKTCFVIAVVLLIAGGFLAQLWIVPRVQSYRARTYWVKSTAVVVSHEKQAYRKSTGGKHSRMVTAYRSHLNYRYEYLGESYRGSRYSFEKDVLLSRINRGDQLNCYINPENPAESVIRPVMTDSEWPLVVIAAFLLLLSPCMVYLGINERRQRRSVKEEETVSAAAMDEEANAVDWEPCRGGGSSFRTHNLVERNPDRLETVRSLGAKLFALPFLVPGLFLSAMGVVSLSGNRGEWFMLPFGLLFVGVGVMCWCIGRSPAVFDRQRRAFWHDRRNPEKLGDPAELKEYTPFKEIKALQLLAERCTGQKGHVYYSYELNLVLKDGRRINVLDHGDAPAIRQSAETISRFIGGLPIWDRIDEMKQ